MYDHIEYEVNDPSAIIWLNRPDTLNAATDLMLAELRHAIAAAEDDPRVVGIIVTGKGRGFCSGRDISDVGGKGGRSKPEGDGSLPVEFGDPDIGPDYGRTYTYMATVKKPVIAAVNGPAAGLGFVIAMMCDMRFMANEAFLMSAFPQRGLVAEHGISWLLPRLIGSARALEMMWSSRKVRGPEAVQMGLAEKAVPLDDLIAEATGFVQGLADSVAPSALHVIKRQVYRHLQMGFGEALDESWDDMAAAGAGADFKEGIAAFREKRKDQFSRIGTNKDGQ